jgi:hypothetical protein
VGEIDVDAFSNKIHDMPLERGLYLLIGRVQSNRLERWKNTAGHHLT